MPRCSKSRSRADADKCHTLSSNSKNSISKICSKGWAGLQGNTYTVCAKNFQGLGPKRPKSWTAKLGISAAIIWIIIQLILILIAISTSIIVLSVVEVWHHALPCSCSWAFITGGCSGRGAQWMGVVLYNELVHNVIWITAPCFHCTPLWWILSSRVVSSRSHDHES